MRLPHWLRVGWILDIGLVAEEGDNILFNVGLSDAGRNIDVDLLQLLVA